LSIKRQQEEEATQAIKRFFKENPEFEQLGRLQIQCLKETGFIDWYDWNLHHWGTKWNASEGEIFFSTTHDGISLMEFKFDTAWCVSEQIWDKLVGLFPNVAFKTVFFEEAWAFAGDGTFNVEGERSGLVDYQPNPKEKKWRDFYEIVYQRPYRAWYDEEPDAQEGE
jgi:hypothetical protein